MKCSPMKVVTIPAITVASFWSKKSGCSTSLNKLSAREYTLAYFLSQADATRPHKDLAREVAERLSESRDNA